MRSLLTMPLLLDSHCDMAWNMLCFGRDYTRSVAETRRLEWGSQAVEANEETLIGWPEYQKGQVAVIFGTLFAAPRRYRVGTWDKLYYQTPDEAHELYRKQLDAYHALADSSPDHFRIILNRRDLQAHLKEWSAPGGQDHPVGIVILMEGAEGIRNPAELPEWRDGGVRLIGLSWAGTRYAGGTKEPGPLTDEGKRLVRAMADHQLILDLSHMDEPAALEAADLYDGTVAASHVNCLALLPEFPTNRHFSDAVLMRIIEHGGVIGNMPVNNFLKTGWSTRNGSKRGEVPLETFINHIDHVCQLAGDSLHSAIGTDFDGGFGLQSVPPEIDTIADIQKVAPRLEARGYSVQDIENIFHGNWLRLLDHTLPA